MAFQWFNKQSWPHFEFEYLNDNLRGLDIIMAKIQLMFLEAMVYDKQNEDKTKFYCEGWIFQYVQDAIFNLLVGYEQLYGTTSNSNNEKPDLFVEVEEIEERCIIG